MSKVLIVDDDAFQRMMLKTLLEKRLGYNSIEAENGAQAIASLHNDHDQKIIAILLDLSMPTMDGRTALPQLLALRPDLPIIVVTASQSLNDAVDVMKLGATDFLPKPPDPGLLKKILEKAMQLYDLRREVENLRNSAGKPAKFSSLIGNDAALCAAQKLGQRAAASDVTVMITGESGAGKEVMARAIHGESERASKPFVAVNCGAIPKDLVESTLFGHKKGSFTGAIADSLGKFREADGGTLFLDEIGELPPDVQVKLLRALQQREVEPVGGGQTVPVNIRVIAATNRNLAHAVQKGHFREDLFYRLNVFPIHMPPLRERSSDILPLSMHFLIYYAAQEGKELEGFDEDAQNWLKAHSWLGNVRELENTIFRAVLLSEGKFIGLEHILPAERDRPAILPSPDVANVNARPLQISMLDAEGRLKPLEQIKQEAVQLALSHSENNMTRAAQQLGLGKSTLYRLVKTRQ